MINGRCVIGLNISGSNSLCHRNTLCTVQHGTTGELCSLRGSQKYPRDVLFINQLLMHFRVCVSVAAHQGRSAAPTGFQPPQTCSPPLALTYFSINLQEALLQHCDLLLNRLSLVLTHDKLSQLGNAGCIIACMNAKTGLIQKHQKKELGVNLT